VYPASDFRFVMVVSDILAHSKALESLENIKKLRRKTARKIKKLFRYDIG
jgi:hypothetical protein